MNITQIREDDRYCTYCGTKLETESNTCHSCGKELKDYEQIKPDYKLGELIYYKNEAHKVEDIKLLVHPASQLYEEAYKLEGINGYIFWEKLFYDNAEKSQQEFYDNIEKWNNE